MLRAARFLRTYLADREGRSPESEEVRLRVGDDFVEGTLYRGRDAPAPGWIVLHGITVRGRKHASLVRFARALAGSGATVLVPDVPSWRALRIDAEAARATLIAGAAYLRTRPEVAGERFGAVGFSFGATHALVAAADPELRDAILTVIGFGGYCDLRRATECMMTGEHEWAGRRFHLSPDPYGRWIVAANYLPFVPGCEGMTAVARGALRLAEEAGARGSFAGGPEYDELKAEIRGGLSAKERRVWELLAPPADRLPADLPAARRLGLALAEAALSRDPSLDPRPVLGEVGARVVLAHGHGDRLIPFTETLRLLSYLPHGGKSSATVTRLFAHSAGAPAPRGLGSLREGARFFALLRRALG